MYNDVSRFKVGDKVKVIDCKHGHFFTIGSTVKIVSHDALNGDYDCSDGNEAWYLREEEMELVNEGTVEKETQMTAEQLREEIIRIDARIEEAKKDIENAQTERNSLVDKLREKGFEMVTSHATDGGYAEATVDNVKAGDVLIMVAGSWNADIDEGDQVVVVANDKSDIPFKVKSTTTGREDWTKSDTVAFK